MTDPVPSKELTLQRCPFCGGQPRWCKDDEHECHRIVCDGCKVSIDFDENPDVETVEELRAIMADKWNRRVDELEELHDAHDTLERENDRLKTALRGIQSCSTCEACRGAATLALGGVQTFECIGRCGASVPGPNAYCSVCFLRARRPAHERESPHCSNCSCDMEPLTALDDETLLAIARQWDQGPGATFEFDPPTLLRFMRNLMVPDGIGAGIPPDGAPSMPAPEAAADVESQEFYELMQSYRHMPAGNQAAVCAAFEAVKNFVRGAAQPPGDVT